MDLARTHSPGQCLIKLASDLALNGGSSFILDGWD